MTCRHAAGDPNCGSSVEGQRRREAESYARDREEKKKEKEAADLKHRKELEEVYSRTPDKEKYDVIEMQRVGPHVVMKVLYPNCSKCSYEGNKVMVFLNVTEADIIKWRVIDPHFRNPADDRKNPKLAPSPAARFPASKEGWADALTYVNGKHDIGR